MYQELPATLRTRLGSPHRPLRRAPGGPAHGVGRNGGTAPQRGEGRGSVPGNSSDACRAHAQPLGGRRSPHGAGRRRKRQQPRRGPRSSPLACRCGGDWPALAVPTSDEYAAGPWAQDTPAQELLAVRRAVVPDPAEAGGWGAPTVAAQLVLAVGLNGPGGAMGDGGAQPWPNDWRPTAGAPCVAAHCTGPMGYRRHDCTPGCQTTCINA